MAERTLLSVVLLTPGLMDSSSPDRDTDAREEELRLKMEEEKAK